MKKRIVCFGDSNTWGYIPITGERYDESIRWPARLQEKLGDQDYTVVEEEQHEAAVESAEERGASGN